MYQSELSSTDDIHFDNQYTVGKRYSNTEKNPNLEIVLDAIQGS